MDGHLLNIGCATVQQRNKALCHSPHTSLNKVSAADEVESLDKPTKYQHLQEFPLSATLVDGSLALNINQGGRWGIRQTFSLARKNHNTFSYSTEIRRDKNRKV